MTRTERKLLQRHERKVKRNCEKALKHQACSTVFDIVACSWRCLKIHNEWVIYFNDVHLLLYGMTKKLLNSWRLSIIIIIIILSFLAVAFALGWWEVNKEALGILMWLFFPLLLFLTVKCSLLLGIGIIYMNSLLDYKKKGMSPFVQVL